MPQALAAATAATAATTAQPHFCCLLPRALRRVPPGAVAFRIYDIGGNNRIERSELKRFLVALMADNPDVDLDEQALDDIVDQVGGWVWVG